MHTFFSISLSLIVCIYIIHITKVKIVEKNVHSLHINTYLQCTALEGFDEISPQSSFFSCSPQYISADVGS